MKRLFWILPLLGLAFLVCRYSRRDPLRAEQERLGAEVSAEVLAAPELEIYSLDPAHGGDAAGRPGILPTTVLFGRRKIIGRARITDATERRELAAAILAGFREAPLLGPEGWQPRHALRYRTPSGDKFLVVSFESTHGFIDHGPTPTWFDITRSSEAIWDRILARHGGSGAR